DREQKYFTGFAESTLYSSNVEDGDADIDYGRFREDQQKIMMDVLRKTYLTKYFAKVEDRVRQDAYRFGDWNGVDFLIGPPVIAAFTWFRGFERKITISGDLKMHVRLEPLRHVSDYYHRDNSDMVAGLGFDV